MIAANLNFLENAYQGKTVNLWEEEYGYSFFARAVQLRCFQEVTANTLGIPVPGWLATAIPWLQNALQDHWNANGGYYQSLIPAPGDKAPYDPNSDIVMAAIYGAVTVTDTKLLATAALLRNQWTTPSSPYYYPINGADQQRGIGPMMGRYPGDTYDGDNDQSGIDHPWAICTCNFAELYYRLANEITAAGAVPARRQLGRLLQPGRSHGIDHAGRGRDRAADRRRPDAAGDHLPQRPPRAQRAVRRLAPATRRA